MHPLSVNVLCYMCLITPQDKGSSWVLSYCMYNIKRKMYVRDINFNYVNELQ